MGGHPGLADGGNVQEVVSNASLESWGKTGPWDVVSASYRETQCEALREGHSLKHPCPYRTGIQGLSFGGWQQRGEGRSGEDQESIRQHGQQSEKRASGVPFSF